MSVRRLLFTTVLAAGLSASTLAAPAYAADRRDLSTLMTGWQVAGSPGDSNAWGAANVRVRPNKKQLCYTLFVSRRVDGVVNAAHIHAGAWGQIGPEKVVLAAPVNGWSSGCTTVAENLARDIVQNPRQYHLDVHSTAFPNGPAIRGQLQRQNSNSNSH